MPLDANALLESLSRSGITHFAGVPCSLLNPLTAAANAKGRYLAASVEGEAVAVAAGIWLAGGTGAVLMQNSGLGNAVNPLASLLLPYRIPALLVVSWRGQPGTEDAVHHAPMGHATLKLLDAFDVRSWVLGPASDLDRLAADIRSTLLDRRPAAIVVPRGVLKKVSVAWKQSIGSVTPRSADGIGFMGGDLPDREEAISAVVDLFGSQATISTTGYTSRTLAAYGPRGHHFYMQGSMGFALAIALGCLWVDLRHPTCVLDGDGALLMRLGSLSTAGKLQPRNLVHVVLDNGAYASTGGQPTASSNVDFAAIARACGYARTATCVGRDALGPALAWAWDAVGGGPVLLHLRMSAAESDAAERPEQPPDSIASEFRSWWCGECLEVRHVEAAGR
jgi:phosphonopyruvate decarboxylase